MRGALSLFVALSVIGHAHAQACPEFSTGLGNGQPCQCNDGYTGPLSNPDDPTSGTSQLAYVSGEYRGPCSPCADGYSGAGGSCTICAAGSYQDGSSLTQCLPCGAGSFGGTFTAATRTFTPAEGLGTCTPCPGGYQQLGTSATSCTGCGFGTYSTTGDPAGCQNCPAGSVGPNFRLSQCSNCPNGQHQPEEGMVSCEHCVAGRFATSAEPSPECSLCPVGKFQPVPDPNLPVDALSGNVGQATCNDCPLGSQTEDYSGDFARLGAVTCDACDVGRFLGLNVDQFDAGFAGCPACEAGQFQPAAGQLSCDSCGAGEYQPTPGQTSCIACTAGSQTENAGQSFTDVGAVACQQCGRGRSAGVDANGAADPSLACAECALGRYQDQYGSTQCKACPAGRVVNALASDGLGDCTLCGLGEYQPTPGQAECLSDCSAGRNTVAIGTCVAVLSANTAACAAVTGSDLYDSTACAAVGEGTCVYTHGAFTDTGAVDCAGCVPGRYSVDATGSVPCTDCDIGQSQPTAGQTSCSLCGSGRYQPDTGQATCLACQGGSQTEDGSGVSGASTASAFTDTGAIACEVCGVGFTGSDPDVACLMCEPGHYQDEIGQPQCKACSAGKFSAVDGSVSVNDCIDCAVNEYQPTPGSASCLTCSEGSQPEGVSGQWVDIGAVACDACEAGRYGDTLPGGPGSPGGDMMFACVACDIGQFQAVEQQTSCIACLAGEYQPGIGAAACIACPVGSQTETISGSFTSSGAVACDACVPGRSADVDAQGNPDATLECALCVAGQFQNQVGQTSCKACFVGRYVETEGSTVATQCIACPAGTYSHLTSLALASDCIPCVGGKYVATTGNDEASDCINCPSGRFVLAAGSDALADCTACTAGTYQPGPGHTSCIECAPGHQTEASTGAFVNTAATMCTGCVSGRYNTPDIPAGHSYPSELECAVCGPGSMTADVSDPAMAVFQLHAATGCASCYAPVESCTAIDSSNADHVAACSAATLDGHASSCTDIGSGICAYTANAQDLLAQDQDCVDGACGYADRDADSATACAACPVGTFVDSDGQVECTDFDECASSPCENGGLCTHAVLAHPLYFGNPVFKCDCSTSGFIGERCSFLDECAHDPCYLTHTTPPAELDVWPSTSRTPNVQHVFMCPTRMECTDPDKTVRDDYVCTCPTCSATVFTPATASLIADHFTSHPGYAKHLVGMISRLDDPRSVCAQPSRPGCTDPEAYNFDELAQVDDGSCVRKVYGCTDPLAINFDPAANQYDSSGVLGERCRAAVCAPRICGDALNECSGENADDTGVTDDCYDAISPHLGVFGDCTSCDTAVTSGATVCAACEAAVTEALASCAAGVAPTCPDGWTGPRGGECVRHVHGQKQTMQWACGGDLVITEFGDCPSCLQVDECGTTAPDPVGPCNNPSQRLCVEATGPEGYVAPDCTNTRQAFVCAENVGGSYSDYDFACVDPNPYWMGDFTCSCAFDHSASIPGYTPEIAGDCGTDTVFTDSSTGTSVSNYELTFYLHSREGARNHLCEQLHDPAPDCMKLTGMCSGNTGHEWRWSAERDVACGVGFQLKAESHTIPRGDGVDYASAEALAACCEQSPCTASFPMPASSGYGVGRQHGVDYSPCSSGPRTGDTCVPICAQGFFDGGTSATGFELLCSEAGEYPIPSLDDTLVCTACNDMSSIASVASCQVCSDATAASCTDGTCADGYHTFQSGVDPSCIGTCSTVDNAEDGATYTCTDATDSRVSGCADGYFLTVGGAGELDTCSLCDPVENAVAVTCAEAGNSRATACDAGYALEDNSGAEASDRCYLDAAGR